MGGKNIFVGFERLVFTTDSKKPSGKRSNRIFLGVSSSDNVTLSTEAAKIFDIYKTEKSIKHVVVMYNKTDKKLAITPSSEKDSNGRVEFYPKAGYSRLSGAPFYKILKSVANIEHKAFRIMGKLAKDGKSVIFDLNDIEMVKH